MVEKSDGAQPESAADWWQEIDGALKREKPWRERARKVVQRYRDERSEGSSSTRVNILWSNTEVLKAAILPRTAKPDIRRRFPDTARTTQVSRAAAEVVERSVIYANDVGEVQDPISAAVDDVLLPGRGTCWVSYEPEIEGDEAYGAENEEATVGPDVKGNKVLAGSVSESVRSGLGREDGAEGEGASFLGQSGPRITSQTLTLDYVYWEDFTHGKARKWCDVPWVGRRHVLRKDQFRSKFPNATEGIKLDYKLEDASGETGEGPDYVEVWEIWDRPSSRRLYIGRGYANVLQSDDDPYGLNGFFPCPKPLTSITTTDRLVPSPEFLQYQDQANELDTIATRINNLIAQLQFKGVYDGSLGGDKSTIGDVAKAGDGEFLPYDGWTQLKEKGGIEAAFGFWPIERIPPVIQQLTDRAARITQQIYEVTGISDIVRGSTDPNETKGAQQLKAQFGSMRMQSRRRDVQRFVRDCYRMEAEIIAEHFTADTLKEITGLDFPDALALPLPALGGPALQPQAPSPQSARGGLPSMMGASMGPSTGATGPSGIPVDPLLNDNWARTHYRGSLDQSVPGEMQPSQAPGEPPPEKPTWDAIIAILRSDKMRGYRIDIETDETILEDADAEKQSRIEFMGAVNDMLEKAYIAATQAPMMLPLIRETFMFGIRSFKVGRSLEQSAEDAFDELIKNPPQPPQPDQKPSGPDPEVQKAELAAKVKADQDKLTLEQQRLQAEIAKNDNSLQADIEHKRAQIALDQERLRVEVQKIQADAAFKNKQVFNEASAGLQPDGSEPPADPNQPPAASPIELMIGSIQQLAAAIAQGEARQTQQIANLAQAMTAPKQIVRGPDGRAIGVQTVTQTIQ